VPQRPSPPAGRNRLLLSLGLGLLLSACAPEAPPTPEASGPRRDACLKDVVIDQLPQAIQRCDAVVAAHPRQPQPRNERALLLSLAGRNEEACRDSVAAARLLAALPQRPAPDPALVDEIRLRQQSCLAWQRSRGRAVTTPPATGAPAAATPAAPGR
jgi:hypothetical protein